jgi:hypothetical protein
MFPFHYDSRYDYGGEPFDTRGTTLESIVRTIAGRPVNKEDMSRIRGYLSSKQMLEMNPGDEQVQNEIQNALKMLKSARRVVAKWLT